MGRVRFCRSDNEDWHDLVNLYCSAFLKSPLHRLIHPVDPLYAHGNVEEMTKLLFPHSFSNGNMLVYDVTADDEGSFYRSPHTDVDMPITAAILVSCRPRGAPSIIHDICSIRGGRDSLPLLELTLNFSMYSVYSQFLANTRSEKHLILAQLMVPQKCSLGAGGKLLSAITAQADEEGLIAVAFAHEREKALFEQHGFVEKACMNVCRDDDGILLDEWPDQFRFTCWFMVRKPVSVPDLYWRHTLVGLGL